MLHKWMALVGQAVSLPLVLQVVSLPLALQAGQPAPQVDLRGQRLVFLGDSITDGFSYPLLIKQALEEAHLTPPVLICAGIGGDTAAGMAQRLERDVFVHKPTFVTLSAGINDVLHKVAPADYEKSAESIAAQLKARGIPLLILTTSILGPKCGDADKQLEAFNAALRSLAQRESYRLAEVNRLMNKARDEGLEALEEDHVHPNYQGHRVMARAVLDALGYADVPVPKDLKVTLMPGVVREWKIRAAPAKSKPLDEMAAAALKPDAAWIPYSLPEKEPVAVWWLNQERQRGLAVSLERALGKAETYWGMAEVEAERARPAFVNTGAGLKAVWLNGKRIYQADAQWKGWHPGRERLPVELAAGKNTLLIETGKEFFLSITETNDW
ncbi:MAG: GDSL-type esterase/lipase family protein [Planctomycetota bacterium]